MGDMPFIKPVVEKLAEVFLANDVEAVAAGYNSVVSPPTIFSRAVVHKLFKVEGDLGARKILLTLNHRIIKFEKRLLTDIDEPDDFEQAKEILKDLSGSL